MHKLLRLCYVGTDGYDPIRILKWLVSRYFEIALQDDVSDSFSPQIPYVADLNDYNDDDDATADVYFSRCCKQDQTFLTLTVNDWSYGVSQLNNDVIEIATIPPCTSKD